MIAEHCPLNESMRDDVSQTTVALVFVPPDTGTLVESVEKVVSGISIIGHACEALRAAGWNTKIAANRITIDDAVEALLIPARRGMSGISEARWIVSAVALSTMA